MEYVIVGALLVYIAPFTVAAGRDHPRARSILALNLALGWTGIGWLAALAWAWPERTHRPRLYAVPPSELLRPGSETSARPWDRVRLAAAAAALATAAVLAAPGAWPAAPWWPEPQRGAFAARVERLGAAGAPLHRSPVRLGGFAEALPPGCEVWVVEHRGGWKRVWKTAECRARAPGRAEGWIPSHRSHPRKSARAPAQRRR
ncbi:MAG: superinfection immunity protein [Myxococcota bacterium]